MTCQTESMLRAAQMRVSSCHKHHVWSMARHGIAAHTHSLRRRHRAGAWRTRCRLFPTSGSCRHVIRQRGFMVLTGDLYRHVYLTSVQWRCVVQPHTRTVCVAVTETVLGALERSRRFLQVLRGVGGRDVARWPRALACDVFLSRGGGGYRWLRANPPRADFDFRQSRILDSGAEGVNTLPVTPDKEWVHLDSPRTANLPTSKL